jgi:hypothetical protein
VNAYTSGAGLDPGILYPPNALKYALTDMGSQAGPVAWWLSASVPFVVWVSVLSVT